jgi:hypothetical protein
MGKIVSAVAPLAGAAIGASMGNPMLGAQLGGAVGGLFGGGTNVSGAYGGASAQQLAAAQQASQMAQFRPVGITTNFGKSNFEIDPNTGMLKSAGYTLAPQLQGLQTSLLGGYGSALQQAQGLDTTALNQGAQSLYGLGQGYLGESPDAVRQRFISQQQALLAPENEQTLAGIRNRLFQTGRTGLATGGTSAGSMSATNPEMAAYYNALARQQAQLAAGAEQAAQQQITFGQGLLTGGAGLQGTGYQLQSAAYDPLKTQLGLGSSIESLGAQALGLGSELGGRSSTAGARAGDLLSTGTRAASLTGLAGQVAQQDINAAQQRTIGNQVSSIANSPQVQNWFSNILGGGFNGFDLNSTSTPGLWQTESFD